MPAFPKKFAKETVAQGREVNRENENRFSEIAERGELASVQETVYASYLNSFSLSVTDCVKAPRKQE